jgi:hypothetical protein
MSVVISGDRNMVCVAIESGSTRGDERKEGEQTQDCSNCLGLRECNTIRHNGRIAANLCLRGVGKNPQNGLALEVGYGKRNG